MSQCEHGCKTGCCDACIEDELVRLREENSQLSCRLEKAEVEAETAKFWHATAEANREDYLAVCIDRERLTAERDKAQEELASIATAAGAYPDSDLLSLVAALKRAADVYDTAHDDCVEEALAEARDCGCGHRIAERIRKGGV